MPRYTATSGRKCERLLPVTATSKYKRGLGCKRTNTSQTTMRPIGTHGKDERNRGGASASPLHIVAARVSKRKMQRRAEKKKVAARPAFVRVPSGSTCRGAHSPRRVPAPTWGRAGRASASVKRYPPAPQFRPGPRGKAARPAAAPRGGVLVSSGAARGLALSGPAGSAPRGRLRARPACPRLASVPLSVAVAPPAGLAPRKRVAGVAKRRLRARRPRAVRGCVCSAARCSQVEKVAGPR